MKLATVYLALLLAYPFSGPSVTQPSHLPFPVIENADSEGFEVCTGVGLIHKPKTFLFYANDPFAIVSGKNYETTGGYWNYLRSLNNHDTAEGTCFWVATREDADQELKEMKEEHSKDSRYQPVEIRRTAYVYQDGDEKKSPD